MKQIINVRKAISVEEVPEPLCGDREVLVANAYSLISAGTERHSIEMRSKSMVNLGREMQKERPDLVAKVKKIMKSQGLIATYKMVKERLNEPNTLGYSSAGIVIEVGREVKSIKVGDRVACGGAGAVHAEMVRVPENLCVRVPDNVTLKEAAFTTLGAIAMQGVRRADARVGENVVVIGLGLVGLLTVQILKSAGCNVLGLDISAEKVALAKKLGVNAHNTTQSDAFSLVNELTGGVGADSVIITASTQSDGPVSDALRMIRKKGRIVVVGAVGMKIQREPFYEKEGDFLISTSYGPGRYDPDYEEKGHDYPIAYVRWTERRNMESFLELVSAGTVRIKPLITHVFPVEKGPEAYEVIKDGKGVGVLLEYAREVRNAPERKVPISSVNPGKKELNIGIIGAGSFARKFHLPNIASMDGMRIYAVATNTGSNAKFIAKKYSASYATTDYRKIINDRNVDAVVISTRHNLHAKIAMEALKAGKHVFVEKPAAMDEKELGALMKSAGESGRVLMVGLNRRFSPHVKRAKQELAKKAGPVMVEYRVNAGKLPPEHWIYDPKEGGGRVIGEGVHFLDVMGYLAGSRPVSISVASMSSKMSGISPEDNFSVIIEYENGSIGTLIYTSTGSPEYPKEHIYAERDGLSIVIDDFRDMEIYGRSRKRMKLKKQDKGHRQEMVEFMEGIRKGKSPMSLKEIERAHALAFSVSKVLRG